MRAAVACIITDSFICLLFLQVWFRVNDLLPDELQKSLPDTPPEMLQNSTDATGKSTEFSVLECSKNINKNFDGVHLSICWLTPE